MTPQASILIPTRNRAEFLKQALSSAISQDCDAYEIVVVDDASTDSTPTFLAQIDDPKIRVYRHVEKVSMQRNIWLALNLAQGAYAVVLSDDDLLAPDFLTRGLEALKSQAAPTFFVSGYTPIDFGGHVIPGRMSNFAGGLVTDPHTFFKRNVAPLCSVLFPVQAIRNLGFVDNLLFDWTWWNALCLSGSSVYFTASPLASHRIHAASVTETVPEQEWSKAVRDMCRFLQDHFDNSIALHLWSEEAEARWQYWVSRDSPEAWRTFIKYGLRHFSREVLKLFLMRCVPLDALNFVRHSLGRGPNRMSSPGV